MNAQHCGGERELECNGCASACGVVGAARLAWPKLAECVALWGEPEQAVHGMKERGAAASSGMKGKRVTIRLVVVFAIALHLQLM